MALEDGNGMVMPVTPMYGNAYNNGGFGGFGNDGFSYLIILFLFAMFGGWGNGFGNNGAGNGCSFPWMLANNTDNLVTAGFNQSATAGALSGIQSAITNGFGNAEVSRCNAQANILQTLNANQNATTASMNNIASNLQNCCCENRLATCQTQNIVQNEGNATRFADANNTRDIIDSQNRGTQAILDKLCSLELEGVKGQLAQAQRENVGLQNQLNMATMQNGMNNEVDALYNRLKNCPVPSMPVYGMTPIFTCPNNSGCGCGCSGNF